MAKRRGSVLPGALLLLGGATAVAVALLVSRRARASTAGLLPEAQPSREFPPPVLPTAPDRPPVTPAAYDAPEVWLEARLTEYHPDAPKAQRTMEGGAHDWASHDLITLQQHRGDRAKYPYVSVSADLVLRGRPVAYGTRIYLEAFPDDDVFRIVDTGCNFSDLVAAVKNRDGKVRCKGKQIRVAGHEPFDVATTYSQRGGISGKLTRYRVDPADYLAPHRLHPYTKPRPAVA